MCNMKKYIFIGFFAILVILMVKIVSAPFEPDVPFKVGEVEWHLWKYAEAHQDLLKIQMDTLNDFRLQLSNKRRQLRRWVKLVEPNFDPDGNTHGIRLIRKLSGEINDLKKSINEIEGVETTLKDTKIEQRTKIREIHRGTGSSNSGFGLTIAKIGFDGVRNVYATDRIGTVHRKIQTELLFNSKHGNDLTSRVTIVLPKGYRMDEPLPDTTNFKQDVNSDGVINGL